MFTEAKEGRSEAKLAEEPLVLPRGVAILEQRLDCLPCLLSLRVRSHHVLCDACGLEVDLHRVPVSTECVCVSVLVRLFVMLSRNSC